MPKNNPAEKVIKLDGLYENDPHRLKTELKKLAREGAKAGDILQVGVAYHRLAVLCNDLGETDDAFSYAFKATEILKDAGDHEAAAKAFIALGFIYGEQENYQMELVNYDRAYSIITRHRIKGNTRITALNDLSTGYHSLGDYKTAKKLLTEGLALAESESEPDYSDLAMYNINLADCWRDGGQPERAKEIFDKMELWADKIEYAALKCDYHLRRAQIYYELNENANGDACVDRALACVPEDSYPLPLYDDLREVLQAALEHGDRARADALFALMQKYSGVTKSSTGHIIALKAIAGYYRVLGDYKRAAESYEALEEYTARRLEEQHRTQLNLHARMKDADVEIRNLRRKMRESEALHLLEPMTKLLNRAALLRVSEEFIGAAAKKKQKVGAIFIDIDFFKECNDTYGHPRGDEIIREVAEVCRGEETQSVRFARYGGDEFFGITRGMEDKDVVEIAKRVCAKIREANIPNEKNPHGGKLTLSAGVVNVPITGHTDTIIEIANYADKALYRAKNSGKNAIFLLDRGGGEAEYEKIEF